MAKNGNQAKGKGRMGRVKSLPQLLALAQKVFNAHVRNRDKNQPCICCGSFDTSDASHYFSAGHYSSLRFSEMNVNLSCKKCNTFLHGNLIQYRQGLVKKYGEENVKLLENTAGLRKVRKWAKFELELICKMYK